MRVLFVHPKDDPAKGPWAAQKWDRIVDLGFAGSETYARWSAFYRCSVESLGFPQADLVPVRELLAEGRQIVLDKFGIDWWDVLSVFLTQQLISAEAIEKVATTLGANDQLFVSRRDLHSRFLESFAGGAVTALAEPTTRIRKTLDLWQKARRLSYAQAKNVIWDRYDPQYRLRRFMSPARSACRDSVVLLPSAYVNVSRMALAYAETLPEERFLLVSARPSGWCKRLPRNVEQADLASFVKREFNVEEHLYLVGLWKRLCTRLKSNHLFHALLRAGLVETVENRFHHWIAVRDAWHCVFEERQIRAVLCCDDNNPYTKLPVLLGTQRGLPSIASHHGVLDGQKLLRKVDADLVLAKGPMERDYLIRRCGVPRSRVGVSAPRGPMLSEPNSDRDTIVFFSEDYEVSGGRVEEFYRELFPPLVTLARNAGKKIVLKLHPAESVRERRLFLKHVLGPQEQALVHIVTGPASEELMNSIWFAVTVISTTALDCALRRIPVFLCSWLENWPYGYADQLSAFGVGVALRGPTEIDTIPSRLANFPFTVPTQLWQSDPERLKSLLSRPRQLEAAAAF